MARWLSVCIVFLITFLCSCRSTAPSIQGSVKPGGIDPSLGVSDVLRHLPSAPASLSELYMETSVALSSPDEHGRFSTRISHRKHDSTLIRVRFPLGIEGARVLITPDSAFVYDRVHKELFFGRADRITDVLPGAVPGTDLVELALDFGMPDPEVSWMLSSDRLRYHLFSPDSTLHYAVDPVIWRIVQYEKRTTGGTIIEQRWYTDFAIFNQIVLPRHLNVSRPKEDTRLSMTLRKLDTEPVDLSFDLKVRSDARRTRID